MKQDETALRGAGNLNSVPFPVLFTCPHGGRVEFSPVRDDSNVSCGPGEFRIKSDNNTIDNRNR